MADFGNESPDTGKPERKQKTTLFDEDISPRLNLYRSQFRRRGTFSAGINILMSTEGREEIYPRNKAGRNCFILEKDRDGSLIHCFSHSNLEDVEIIGHSPDDGMSMFEVLAEYTVHDRVDGEIQESRIMDIETATGVSVEEFYEIYSQPTTRCLVSDYDIWWGH